MEWWWRRPGSLQGYMVEFLVQPQCALPPIRVHWTVSLSSRSYFGSTIAPSPVSAPIKPVTAASHCSR